MIWILHLLCVIFFLPGLLLTIPAHMLISMASDAKKFAEWAKKKNEEANQKKTIYDGKWKREG